MMVDRDKYLARQKRYNDSYKGKKRRERYEEKHPERTLAGNPVMRLRAGY